MKYVLNPITGKMDLVGSPGASQDLSNYVLNSNFNNVVNTIDGKISNIDNTSDVNKPVSNATVTAIALAISNLVSSSPATLDTLNELATALGNDPNFATTIATSIGLKANITSPTLLGVPLSPTAIPGTDTTQIATTAFVASAISSLPASTSSRLLAFTELNATALVTHTVTTSATATAINLNSDGTDRFAKVVFVAPASGQVSVKIDFDAVLTNASTNLRIGLHNSSTATTTPINGWFRVNGDDDGASNGYTAEFILTGLTPAASYTRYFLATSNYGSTLIRASSSQTGVFAVSDLPQPLRIKVEDLGSITISTNPNS